jgi:hypothetical protein
MNTRRLLLCRPTSGLNDIFAQIDKVCRYAEQAGRIVVVDTNCQSTKFFKDDLSNYFVSRQPHLRLSPVEFSHLFDQVDVYPDHIFGKVNSYTAEFDRSVGGFVDTDQRKLLSFDFTKNYSQQLLVHHSGGNQAISLAALGRLRLHDGIVDILIKRLRMIGSPYTGIHVRHTDYQTAYEEKIEHLKGQIQGPIFLATDNRDVLNFVRMAFGSDRVFSFATLPREAGKPLHKNNETSQNYETNTDAIVDLIMLSLSSRFYFFPLSENQFNADFSGYAVLANQLRLFPSILSQLISRCDQAVDRVLPLYR